MMPISIRQVRNTILRNALEPASHCAPIARTGFRLKGTFFSIVLHGTLFALILFQGIMFRPQPVRLIKFQPVGQITTSGGSSHVHIPFPKMFTAARTPKPIPYVEEISKVSVPVEQRHPALKSGGGAPVDPHSGTGAGSAEIGNGTSSEDREPAFPVFAPHPPVADRALLPPSEQKIVVNVKLDASGAVVGETLVKGLGNQLDQTVLDTVKTWKFHPATIDGRPVPSEAEVIFPFTPSYPISTT